MAICHLDAPPMTSQYFQEDMTIKDSNMGRRVYRCICSPSLPLAPSSSAGQQQQQQVPYQDVRALSNVGLLMEMQAPAPGNFYFNPVTHSPHYPPFPYMPSYPSHDNHTGVMYHPTPLHSIRCRCRPIHPSAHLWRSSAPSIVSGRQL